jgi:cysteine desulfurase
MKSIKSIYLDYAAATPMSESVVESMLPYFTEHFHNPSATYLDGRSSRSALETSRQQIAQCLGARSGEIIFTAGATEANNLAVQGVAKMYPEAEILVSAVEHDSVLQPARATGKVRIIPVDSKGTVDLEKLEKLITNSTVLVSVMIVNNEIGTVQPIKEITEILNKSRKIRKGSLPLYFHTDAAQAPSYLDLHVSRLGVDLMSINGGKIYGPKQSGILYIKSGTLIKPIVLGGGQENNFRSGTENVAGCVGFAVALVKAQDKRKFEQPRLKKLKDQFIDELSKKIPEAEVNGSLKNSAPHIVSVTFPSSDNERLMMELDEAGVQVAVGSACSASSDESSHVLRAIGLSDEQARSTLRFSFGRQTTSEQVVKTINILQKLVINL